MRAASARSRWLAGGLFGLVVLAAGAAAAQEPAPADSLATAGQDTTISDDSAAALRMREAQLRANRAQRDASADLRRRGRAAVP
jgi:hypothetical protein